MIIDIHGHMSAPTELWAYKANILSHRGAHGRRQVKVSDEEIRAAANRRENWAKGHLDYLKAHGTDLQLISPRPFQLMQSEKPAKLVHWFAEECNNIIYRQMKLFPNTFIGICALPQTAGDPIENALPELQRCIKDLGFVGCLLNPDPFENSGTEGPPLGERYWYPLYEKLCELDVPAHIHGTGSRSERTPYSLHFINEETIAVFGLVNSQVFDDFPELKIIVSHGGGAIPYQLGRFEAPSLQRGRERFSNRMRKLYYDTVLYTEDALRLLIKTVGVECCLFGTECPGTGSAVDPDSGRSMDDIRPLIESIEWLGAEDKQKIFCDNAKKIFKLNL
ncbi:MAG TPA: amidohydrolase family protein [Candidatus Binatia bacterium]|nr:amidohydrolase family protein [Candidatus Binatia bacterium]